MGVHGGGILWLLGNTNRPGVFLGEHLRVDRRVLPAETPVFTSPQVVQPRVKEWNGGYVGRGVHQFVLLEKDPGVEWPKLGLRMAVDSEWDVIHVKQGAGGAGGARGKCVMGPEVGTSLASNWMSPAWGVQGQKNETESLEWKGADDYKKRKSGELDHYECRDGQHHEGTYVRADAKNTKQWD